MTHPPLTFASDVFETLHLDAIARDLIEAARTDADGKAARTLVKSPELTTVVTALRKGAILREHSAPGPVLVIPLIGRIRFEAPARSASADLDERRVLAMSPGMRHAVAADEDAAFLLVLGGRPRTASDG